MKPYVQPEWAMKLCVGDVLTNGNIDRPVRELSRRPDGRLHTVAFAIKHCSWTGKCFTTYCWNDLICAGYGPTGVRVKLNKRIDKRIAANIRRRAGYLQTLDCCDVRDVP